MSFFKFPLFMGRKKKMEILDAMIEQNKEVNKKTHCDKCGIKFESWMNKWGDSSKNECYCLLCHKEIYFKDDNDFPLMEDEKQELRKLSLNREIKKQ